VFDYCSARSPVWPGGLGLFSLARFFLNKTVSRIFISAEKAMSSYGNRGLVVPNPSSQSKLQKTQERKTAPCRRKFRFSYPNKPLSTSDGIRAIATVIAASNLRRQAMLA
jgi:hypothetical protein